MRKNYKIILLLITISILSIALFKCSSCSKPKELKKSYHYIDTISIKSNSFFIIDTLNDKSLLYKTPLKQKGYLSLNSDTILNNYIVKANFIDTSRVVIGAYKEGIKDAEIILGRGAEVGFFRRNDSIFLYLYYGELYVRKFSPNVEIIVKSIYNVRLALDTIGYYFKANFKNVEIVPIVDRSVDIDSIEVSPPGEIIKDDRGKGFVKLNDKDIEYLIKFLTKERVYYFLNYYKIDVIKKRVLTRLLPDYAYINIPFKFKFRLTKNIREYKIIPISLPGDARLKNDNLYWRPKKLGFYYFKFLFVINNIDSIYYSKVIKVIPSIKGDIVVNKIFVPDSFCYKITFDFSNVYSVITLNKKLIYKIFINNQLIDWPFKEKYKEICLYKSGDYDIKIEVQSINKDIKVFNKKIFLDFPPKLKFSILNSTIYSADTIKIDVSKTKDDYDKFSLLRFHVYLKNTRTSRIINKKVRGKRIINIIPKGDGCYKGYIEVVDTKNNSFKKNLRLKVFLNVFVVLKDKYSIHVNQKFTPSIRIKGDNIDSIFVDFNNDKVFDYKTRLKRIIKPSYIYRKEGKYNLVVYVKTKDKRISKFSSIVNVINTPTYVKILPIDKDYYVKERIPIKIEIKDPDNKIVKIKYDFNGDGIIDSTFKRYYSVIRYAYKRKGRYKLKVFVETDDDKITGDSISIVIKNHKPYAIAPEDITPRKGEMVTLKGYGRDIDGKIIEYAWDFDNDGIWDYISKSPDVKHKFYKYSIVILRVMDEDYDYGYDTMRVVICPDDMVLIKEGKFCIDRYEYPNKKYEKPMNNVSFYEAVEICKKQGKHLCFEDEWEQACEGKFHYRYPYGNSFSPRKCNTFNNKKTISPSGEFYRCRSFHGVYDLSGNLSEWVQTLDGVGRAYGGNYLTKGFNSTCKSYIVVDKKKRFFHIGFRCCK